MGEILFLCMWSKEFYLFCFVVLQMFSLYEIWILTSDAVCTFIFFNLVIIDYFSQRLYFAVCLAVFPGVLQYFCVFHLIIESLCFSAFFVLFFEVYTHSYTSWSCIQPSVHVLLVKRQRKSLLPRISTFWPREMYPEEFYTDRRQCICLFCIGLIRRLTVGGQVQTKKHRTQPC